MLVCLAALVSGWTATVAYEFVLPINTEAESMARVM